MGVVSGRPTRASASRRDDLPVAHRRARGAVAIVAPGVTWTAVGVCSASPATYRPVPPPVAPPLPPPMGPPGAGGGPVGDWEGPEGGGVVPDRDGVDDDGLGRSAGPSLAHPPVKSISTRLMAASDIGAVIPRMFRHVRAMDGPLRDMQKQGCVIGPPGSLRGSSLKARILALQEQMTRQNATGLFSPRWRLQDQRCEWGALPWSRGRGRSRVLGSVVYQRISSTDLDV
jgi:hypothetical protein